jgi:hypothetical protein
VVGINQDLGGVAITDLQLRLEPNKHVASPI